MTAKELYETKVKYAEAYHNMANDWRTFETSQMFGRYIGDESTRMAFRKDLLRQFVLHNLTEIKILGETYRKLVEHGCIIEAVEE